MSRTLQASTVRKLDPPLRQVPASGQTSDTHQKAFSRRPMRFTPDRFVR